jgi:uncharacterized LabA/DUF88 family protein
MSREQRICVFIDGANTYTACSRLDLELDYDKVLTYWQERGHLVHAFYYTAIKDNESGSRNPVKDLATRLAYNGYRVVTKGAKSFRESDGSTTIKGNMDIELAIAMLKMSTGRKMDCAVLFSGDGDFRRLVEAVQDEGVHVVVISSTKTKPVTCSDELRKQADGFLDIADLPDIHRSRAGGGGGNG